MPTQNDEFGTIFIDLIARASARVQRSQQEALGPERFGQAVFNEAVIMYGAHADDLRGTNVDCFYDDKKVEAFLGALYESVAQTSL